MVWFLQKPAEVVEAESQVDEAIARAMTLVCNISTVSSIEFFDLSPHSLVGVAT